MTAVSTGAPPLAVGLTPAGVPARLRAQARYAWNNSPAVLVRAARRLWDGRGTDAPSVWSGPATGVGPTLVYVGLPIGETNALQLWELRRERLGGGDAPMPRPRHQRSTVSWADLRAGRWPDADIVLVGAEEHRVRGLPAARSLITPLRVHLVVEVPPDAAAMEQQISKRERWEFRRNRQRAGWRLEQDGSDDALRFFYERMHVPTMQARHGERSRSESLAIAREAILRRGTLFFVHEGDRRVAGVLCHLSRDRRTLTTRLLGVLDGADEHYASGAFKAVYHLVLEWAAGAGVSNVDFYGTEALLSKGIFQWKRKFAPRVVLPPNHFASKRLYVHVHRDTPAVRDFLVANPMLAIAGRRLRPVYFTDAQRPANLRVAAKCPGLPEPEFIDLNEFLGDGRSTP